MKLPYNFLHCPDYPDKTGAAVGYYPSYGYNTYLSGVALAKVDQPANIIYFGDSCQNNASNLGGYYYMNNASRVAINRHDNGCVLSYVDGHVKFIANPHNPVFGEKGNPLEAAAFKSW
jgi:prepilin-type processing-associated H-X9-DG protein